MVARLTTGCWAWYRSGMSTTKADASESRQTRTWALTRRHLRIGWCWLLLFLTVGLVVETLHFWPGFGYREPAREMTRLMWRLAHVHGTLLGLVNVGFGLSVAIHAAWSSASRSWASRLLIAASCLLPLGFLAGGFAAWDGDPSWGAFAVPVGAIFLLAGVLLTAIGMSRQGTESGDAPVVGARDDMDRR